MKHYTLYYIIGLLLTATQLSGQVKVRWTPEPHQELGTIDESEGIVTRRYIAYNVGEYSWQVLRGYTSCGCTQAELTQNQMVRPGDSAMINVSFDPRGKAGPVSEVVTIQLTDGEDVVNETLSLTGIVRRSAESIRKQFPIAMGTNLRINTDKLDFGEIRKGQGAERHIAICNTSALPLTLKAELSSSAIKTNWNENTITILPDESLDLMLTWHADAESEWGLIQSLLTVECIGNGDRASAHLSAIILPKAAEDPSRTPSLLTERRIDLSTTQQETITHKLTLQNTGNAPLQVLRIYSDKARIEVPNRLPLSIKPSQSISLEIRINPEGTTDIPITIISTDTKRPRQTVRMRLK